MTICSHQVLYSLDLSDLNVKELRKSAIQASSYLTKNQTLINLNDGKQTFSEISTLGYLLIAHALKEELGDNRKAICIAKNEWGKPYLVGGGREFNLSHSAAQIMLATDVDPVGIDIEKHIPLQDDLDLSIFFSNREIELLYKAENRNELFFKLWTAKESYLKAIGVGFHIDPSTITVLPTSGIVLHNFSYTSENGDTWNFIYLPVADDYTCALCSQKMVLETEINDIKLEQLLRNG